MIEKTLLLQTIQKTLFPKYNPKCNPFLGYYHSTFMMHISLTTSMVLTNYYSSKSSFTVVKQKESNKSINSLKTNKSNKSDKSIISKSNKYPILKDVKECKTITIKTDNRVCNSSNLRGLVRSPSLVFIVKVGKSINSRKNSLELIRIRKKSMTLVNLLKILYGIFYKWFIGVLTTVLLLISSVFYLTNRGNGDEVLDNNTEESILDDIEETEIDFVQEETESGFEQEESVELLKDPVISSVISNYPEGLIKDIDYPKEYIDDDNINNINNVDGLINNDDDDVNNVDEFINNDDEIINNVDDNNNNNNNNNNNIIIVENPTDNVLVIVGDLESLEKGKGKEIVNPDNVLEIVGDLESLEKGKGKEIVNPDNVLEIVGDLESLEKGKEIVSPDNVLEIVGDLESLEKDKGKGKGKEIVNTDHSETNLASFSTNEDLYFEQSFRLFMHDGKYLLLSNNALDIEWLNNLKDLSNTTITEESGIQKVNLTIDTEVAQELVYNNNNEELLSTSEVPRTGEGGVYLDNQLRNILDSLLTNGEVTIISPEIAPVSPTTSIDLVTPYTARSPDPINTLPISLDNQYSNLDSLKNSGNFVRCEDPDSLEVSKTHPIPLDLWWEVPPKPSDSEALKAWERDLITRKYWVNRLEESGSNWNEIHISLTTDTLSMENSSSVSDKTVNKSISLLDNIDEGDLANLFNDIDNPNNTYLSKEYEESLVQTNKQTSKPANNGVGELNNIEEGDLERLFSEDTKRSSVPIISGFLSVGLRTIKDLVNKLNNATFKDNKEDIDIIVKDVINNSITTLNEIKNINSKGYVNSYDLMDSINYPNLSHIIKTITARDKKGEIYKNLTPKDMIVLSKWGHQVLLLQLYTFLVNTPKNLSESRDLVLDLDCLINETYGLLDSSIRSKLQNKGLSLIQNTYTGYDTEFQYMEKENINKLLSVQLAVYTKTLLKLPRYTAYTLSTLNPLNNEIYEIAKDNKMNKVLVDEIINGLLQEAKSLSMKSVEYSLNRLVEGLKAMKIPYIENNKEYIFSFRGGTIKEWFNKTDKYTFLELVKVSESLSAKDLDNQQVYIIDLLKKIHNTGPIIKDINNEVNKENIPEEFIGLPTDVKEVPRELMEYVSPVSDRSNKSKYTRTRNQSFTSELVSVTKIRNNHIIGHFINADLTLLEDFEVIKDNLDLVNNCLITLRKPMLIEGVNVHVRDTLLLAPGVKKSLEAIGLLYGEGFKKISIDKEWYDKMEEFLNKHPDDFRKYAMQDALITLVHACHMEDISFNLGGSSIPKTLASLSMLYIKKKWTEDNYKGYQVNESYNLTEANDMLTPKGLSSVGDLGFIIGYYIANYKGGRNESFMYGSNTDTEWFDYDLIGAYTTAMALLGDPDYKRLTRLSAVRLKSMTDEDILYSYIIIKTDFVFKESVKYPSIPCFIDKDITVYPLKGSAILTGAEYLVARNMGCDFVFKDIFLIPFKTVKTEKTGKDDTDSSKDINEIHLKKLSYQPFKECIRELQALRRSHHKTSVYNLIYKAIANSLYGITTKGISNKMRYDFRTKSSVKMKGNDVSNPIIASWITGYVRSVIGELLHNVHALKGVVVSVTTDGFITNIKDLENVILNNDSLSSYLLKSYRFIREDLSGVGVGLELKQSGKGILTWTTRGQYGYEGNITATTGLQRSNYTKEELGELLVKTFNSPDKSTEFIQRSLRSGTDILNKGGMVTPVNRDKIFRMHYDNRRIIEDIPCLGNLRDSKPYNDIETARLNRFVGKLSKSVSYNKNLSVPKVDNSYKNVLDMSVRSFIRGLFNKDYNLDIAVFKSYKEVADFVNCYDPTIRLTPNVIASLKRRPLNTRKILKSNDSVKGFVKHIETKFPSFDKKKFLD